MVRHLMCTEFEKPLIAQIYGNNEEKILKVALDIQEKYSKYFHAIELNIGCPAPKVVKYGWGSSLMRNKEKTLNMIKNISSNLDMPFSIKTRIWLDLNDIPKQKEFIINASKYCKFITVHWRTFNQQHSGEVDRNSIYEVKKYSDENCKIIGNGWIRFYEEIFEKVWNLDGVMIGQAAIWNPRICTGHKPSLQEIWETVIQHLNLSIACELYFNKYSKSEKIQNYETYKFPMPTMKKLQNYVKKIEELEKAWTTFFSIPEFRKFLFCYVKGIENSKEFKIRTCKITRYGELNFEIKKFFGLR